MFSCACIHIIMHFPMSVMNLILHSEVNSYIILGCKLSCTTRVGRYVASLRKRKSLVRKLYMSCALMKHGSSFPRGVQASEQDMHNLCTKLFLAVHRLASLSLAP